MVWERAGGITPREATFDLMCAIQAEDVGSRFRDTTGKAPTPLVEQAPHTPKSDIKDWTWLNLKNALTYKEFVDWETSLLLDIWRVEVSRLDILKLWGPLPTSAASKQDGRAGANSFPSPDVIDVPEPVDIPSPLGPTDPTRSGGKGRPTPIRAYQAEFARRVECGEIERSTLKKQSEVLHEWFEEKFPDAPSSTPKVIANYIRDDYKKACHELDQKDAAE